MIVVVWSLFSLCLGLVVLCFVVRFACALVVLWLCFVLCLVAFCFACALLCALCWLCFA